MYIDDILGVSRTETDLSWQRRLKEEKYESSYGFGGQDTVKISDEARERLAAENAGQEQKESETREEGGTEASGGASGNMAADSTAKQLEELEKQLKKLRAELEKIANNDSIPSDEKEVRVAALQAQIGEVASMIAELKSQQSNAA